MNRVIVRKKLWGGLALGLLLVAPPGLAQEEEAADPVMQMVVDLVSDADRDMRALGLQQVREELPGEAATKALAELLPKLPAESRAELLEALGDRQDVAAKPAIQKMLENKEPPVRAAALRALGSLGDASDVPLFAKRAVAGSDAEKESARGSLVRLRGDNVNGAIVEATKKAAAPVQCELLGVLAARNARESLPTVLELAKAETPAVRVAAAQALRFLVDENDVEAMVALVKSSQDDAERRNAKLALLAVCNRGGEASAPSIAAGLAEAAPPARIVLIQALGRAGGPKALEAVVSQRKADDETVRIEAVRMLAAWPDAAAVAQLKEIAANRKNLRHHVLALRGLIRLASPVGEKPADVALLGEVIGLAARSREKRLAIGVLGGVATAEAFDTVAAALDDPALAKEAGLAAVRIAEKMKDGPKDKIQAVMEKVHRAADGESLGKRAKKLVDSL